MKSRYLYLFSFLLSVSTIHAFDTSYWVWQRVEPLGKQEVQDLTQAGIKDLYWQVGTLVCQEGRWIWREQFTPSFSSLKHPLLHLIPVVRLEPLKGQAFTPENLQNLAPLLDSVASENHAEMLQIDYESPDRLIPEYQNFLSDLKNQKYLWRVSISALGHWYRFTKGFEGLVDEITPMFYDLNPNRESMNAGSLSPLMDASQVDKQLIAWKSCLLPWKVGLPNFFRVSVVDKTGISRGNIRSFSLDEICFSPELSPRDSDQAGEMAFAVNENTAVADTPLHAGDSVFVRYPPLEDLIHVKGEAERLGAKGVIFFRLSAGDDISGYSVRSLQKPTPTSATLTIHQTKEGCLKISNSSGSDLMPLLSMSVRGYAVAIKAPSGSWREALPGQFAKITTDIDGKHPVDEAIGLQADTLYFWFSHLRSSQSLTSGMLQTIPAKGLSYRLVNFSPSSLWQPLD